MPDPTPVSPATPAAPAPITAAEKARLLATLPKAEPFRSPALAAHRAAIAAHRATAFIRYEPVIAGFRLRPVSLRSMDRMAAFGCDLARGSFEDLAIFIWVHHPAFGQFAGCRRRLVIARLRSRLTPRYPHLAGFFAFAGKLFTACGGVRASLFGRPALALAWLLTLGRPVTSEARLAAALVEARELMRIARTDWPAADDSGAAAPLPCAFAAYVLNLVKGSHPGLTADEILDWPLVELVQWLRAIIAEANPRAQQLDATEAALIAAELAPAAAPGSKTPDPK